MVSSELLSKNKRYKKNSEKYIYILLISLI